MNVPIIILNVDKKLVTGHEAQFSNIKAGKAVSSIIKLTLGPRAILKMMLDPIGEITMTNDRNGILREIEVVHPAAKSKIELSRVKDEEVRDGTTSVIVLAGEMFGSLNEFFKKKIHPVLLLLGTIRL